ncbi:serine hydrolase domain-containing protein [Deinococcus humi]|uniref:CubicO group peptidase (Beta-lactamase class C family) n=1 Tax=Deinococcus humi TaxID=662880 RepID=A0A7W8NHE8_9DEIO|nr:serine hydrolase domain-containing protein [Deinococcus humi]MBB5363932.1 CubicO group peptidase (beta-lactamase class C family) [Deinococcus humi]GGO40553.1 penicillin-binding protein [Deinococcus humi]
MTATTKSSTELAAAFEQEAKRLLEEFKIPGVTLGLLTPDGDHLVNLGVTSLENPLPITSDTIFQIGSNTKTLTSLTVSVLEAQGKLKRDDTVRTYLPDFKLKDESVAAELTILDTLTHQGGFQGDLFEDTGDGDDALAKVLDKLAEAPQVVPLRGHWSYNNAGFYIAGRIIEVVTGMTWEAAVTELVLKPLGMDHTFFFPNMIMTHRFVAGHNKIGDEFVVQRPWQMVRSAGPAGSTCSSTVSDMARYAHYIMSGTVAPTSEPQEGEATSASAGEGGSTETSPLATLDRTRLWTPVRPIGIALNGFPGERGQIGQSWFLDQYDDALVISHGGTTVGQQSDFWVSPDRKVGFIAMTNASNGHAMNRKLSEWVKREVLGLTPPEAGSHQPSEDELKDLAGTYLVVGQPLKMDVEVRDGVLTLLIPDTAAGGTKDAALRFIGPDRAIINGGDMDGYAIDFLRDEQGEVEFLKVVVRLYPRERAGADTDTQPIPALEEV